MTAPDPRLEEIEAKLRGAESYSRPAIMLATTHVAYLLAELRKAQDKLADVLAIADIGMNSEHGDPAFIQGWECAIEEIKARIGIAKEES